MGAGHADGATSRRLEAPPLTRETKGYQACIINCWVRVNPDDNAQRRGGSPRGYLARVRVLSCAAYSYACSNNGTRVQKTLV
jgi:hypothetical protein